MKIRYEVKRFGEAMETVLRQNDHKGGWEDCAPGWLLRRLGQEVGELRQAYKRKKAEQIKKECVDVANFAMMLEDVVRNYPGFEPTQEAKDD